jgi:hypothetical protein
MNRFLKNLFREASASGPSRRGGRPAARRPMLRAEGLEDRTVLSTAGMSGSALVINVSPNSSVELFESVSGANRQVEVIGAAGNPRFSINAINATDINVSGGSTVIIDDSNGMPFKSNTTISINGNGFGNSVDLEGSRSVDTNGVYIAGEASPTQTTLAMDNLTFDFGTAVTTVSDSIRLTGGPLFVATKGAHVTQSNFGTGRQLLSGLGEAGGNFIYSNETTVDLDDAAQNGTVNLDATGASSLETQFNVFTTNTGETVQIAATPASVSTSIFVDAGGSEAVLQGNAGAVSISGLQSSTSLIVGALTGNGEFSTKGIRANVRVTGIATMVVLDNANASTNETVTVTDRSISGTGLFGNNAVGISYGNVSTLSMVSGQLTDSYTVKPSSASAEFTTQINLFDHSTRSFSAHVDLNANSKLHLSLFNDTNKAGELFISAPGAKFENSSGVVDVLFGGVLSSQIDFQDFAIKEEHA